jgi:hypothetical protein
LQGYGVNVTHSSQANSFSLLPALPSDHLIKLDRRINAEMHVFARDWVPKGNLCSPEVQASREPRIKDQIAWDIGVILIEFFPNDWVPKAGHVYPQLVLSAGVWPQVHDRNPAWNVLPEFPFDGLKPCQ